jgi:hypothetical protein
MVALRPALAAAVLLSAVGAAAVTAAEPGAACPTWTDPAGDAGPATGTVPVGDKDLDIVGAEVASSEAFFLGRVAVAKLGATGPNASSGTNDQFTIGITVDGVDGELTAKRDTASGIRQAYVRVGQMFAEATAEYNLERNTVTVAATAASVATAAGKPVAETVVAAKRAVTATGSRDFGIIPYDEAPAPETAVLKGFCASAGPAPAPAPAASGSAAPAASSAPEPAPSTSARPAASTAPGASPKPASTASATPASPTSTASAAPASRLTVSGPTRVAYSDPLRLLATLTRADGSPLVGKPLSAAFGGATATARTASDGRARLALASARAAGVHTATARWAGDAQAGPASATVRTEIIRERVVVRIAPGTSDGRHVAVITVRDDDGALLRGGGEVTVFIDGSRRGVVRLDSAGRARWPARSGASVSVSFPGTAGKYLPAKGSSRV